MCSCEILKSSFACLRMSKRSSDGDVLLALPGPVARFQIKNTHCLQEPSTENLLTVRFPLCSSANDSSSAALGNCMEIYSKADSTAMLLALRLATRPAWRQTDSARSLLESMLALPEGWDLRGDLLHRRFQSYPMAGKCFFMDN